MAFNCQWVGRQVQALGFVFHSSRPIIKPKKVNDRKFKCMKNVEVGIRSMLEGFLLKEAKLANKGPYNMYKALH